MQLVLELMNGQYSKVTNNYYTAIRDKKRQEQKPSFKNKKQPEKQI